MSEDLRKSRDSTNRYIVKLSEANQVITDTKGLAYKFKEERNLAYAESDRNVEALSATQQELEFTRGLIANKTLSPADTLNPATRPAAVIKAGLTTINYGRINSEKIVELEKGLAANLADVERLKREKQSEVDARNKADKERNAAVASSLRAEQVLTKELRTRRPLGIGRKNAMAKGADEVKGIREGKPVSVTTSINDESEIEKIENHKQ